MDVTTLRLSHVVKQAEPRLRLVSCLLGAIVIKLYYILYADRLQQYLISCSPSFIRSSGQIYTPLVFWALTVKLYMFTFYYC